MIARQSLCVRYGQDVHEVQEVRDVQYVHEVLEIREVQDISQGFKTFQDVSRGVEGTEWI